MSCCQNRCDVRSVESEDNLTICFKYRFDPSFERYFQFKRSKTESLRQTFARISLNINKDFNKKMKKKTKTKANIGLNENTIDIKLINDGNSVSEDLLNSDVWKSGLN